MIERFRDGHERQVKEDRPGVWSISIRHRLTANGVKPEHWSAWLWWWSEKSREAVLKKHDAAIRVPNA